MADEFTTNKKQRVGEVEVEQETTTIEPLPIQTMVMTGWVCDCRPLLPVITYKSYVAPVNPDAPDTTMESLWPTLDKGEGINKDTVSLLKMYSDVKLVIPMETGYFAKIVFVIQSVRTNDEEPLAEMSALPAFTMGTKWKLCYWQYNDRCETMEFVDDHIVQVVDKDKSNYRNCFFKDFRTCTRLPSRNLEHIVGPILSNAPSSLPVPGAVKKLIMVSITEVV
jgi:hypothetical protein